MSGLSGESVVGAGRLFIVVYGDDAIQSYRQARCAGLQHQIRVLADNRISRTSRAVVAGPNEHMGGTQTLFESQLCLDTSCL